MQATQLCQRCGYDLPGDTGDCPRCRGQVRTASRAARQVAGIDLPTRSVHALQSLPPAPESRARRPLRHPSAAIDLLAVTALLALVTAGAWIVTVIAHTDRFSTRLAPIILDRIDTAVVLLASVTLAAATLTLLAAGTRAVRTLLRR